jgi:hypothetical protein
MFLSSGAYGSTGEAANGEDEVGKLAFDLAFDASDTYIIHRVCKNCLDSHKDIYYRRLTEVPNNVSMYDLLYKRWEEVGNEFNSDFTLHTTYGDALGGSDAWEYCDFVQAGAGDAESVGFPKNCGPTTAVGGQANAWGAALSVLKSAGTAQEDYAFYLERGPAALIAPEQCEAGTYNPDEGAGSDSNCRFCPAGMSCADAGTVEPAECGAGHYCPRGTVKPDQYPCPQGTYTEKTNLTVAERCEPCSVGKACDFGEAVEASIATCKPGHYCPVGTALSRETPCDAGTFSTATGLAEQSQCTDCPAGAYCVKGSSTPTGVCPKGFYCPVKTREPFAFQCPAGSYTLGIGSQSIDDCIFCPLGHYCEPSTTFLHNDALIVAETPGHLPRNEPRACPAGTYMMEGGYQPNPYSPDDDNSAFVDDDRTRKAICAVSCIENYKTDPQLVFAHNPNACVYTGGVCAVKVGGTNADCNTATNELECTVASTKEGTPEYELARNAECTRSCQNAACMTELGPATVQGCAFFDAAVPWRELGTSAGNVTDCTSCKGGYACPLAVNKAYTYENAIADYLVPCVEGTYSKPGADACTACVAGYTCGPTTAFADMAKCPAGAYCPSGLAKPGDATHCEPGYFCPEGSPDHLPCPPGTINRLANQSSLAACLPCDAGYYCVAGTAEVGIAQECAPGYFCPNATEHDELIYGDEGVVIGSSGSKQSPCPGGTYRNTTKATTIEDCFGCPQGYYCPIDPTGASFPDPLDCPVGHYCLPEVDHPTPCPVGTFSNETNLVNEPSCTDCTPGRFCDKPGGTVTAG